MESLKVREFSQTIINFINESDLPMEVKRLALLEIYNQIEEEAQKVIQCSLDTRAKKENAQTAQKAAEKAQESASAAAECAVEASSDVPKGEIE